MALTKFQHDLCRLIARNRIEQGEAYVAGGAALGAVLPTARISRDLDLFHDTQEALAKTFPADLRLMEADGYRVEVVHERPAYIEATITKAGESVMIQWACDSAYRFFPLVESAEFGLALHPFDLATNKVLALVGRAEARDWVDVMDCHRLLQPLGYLAWAACGKDPALNPASILSEARRTVRYTQVELAGLVFEDSPPDAEHLAREWKEQLKEAEEIHAILPADHAGQCVLGADLKLYTGGVADLSRDVSAGKLVFHHGAIGGVWPRLLG